MALVKLKTQCPSCNKQLELSAEVPQQTVPSLRSKIQPIGSIAVYRITTEQIKNWITSKARMYCPNVKVEIAPRYCEKKRRKSSEPHRSYASLRIAFSEEILENKTDLGWYGKIAESPDNIRIQPSMFQNLIKLYGYNSEDVDSWLKSYQKLEELEETFGMTESYIRELKSFVNPQRIKGNDNSTWVIFGAAVENVITDMMTDPNTGHVPGRIQIEDVYEVNKDIVEFLVYLHPAEMKLRENPHVRQILMGDEKKSK